MSLLFRAPADGKYNFQITLTNRIVAGKKRDPFYHIVFRDKLKDQGRLRGYQATKRLVYKQIALKAGDAFEICVSGGGVTFPQAVMETDVLVSRGALQWNAAREFHSPNPGSPVISSANPLAGNVWEYGYRIMQAQPTDDWATMNASLFRHLTLATELGPSLHGGKNSGQDLNCWSTPAVGGLESRGLALHPAPKSGVGVEWISPIDGRIQVSGEVKHLQAIDDGIRWQLEYQPAATSFVVASGVVNQGIQHTLSYSQSKPKPIEISVQRGDVLRLSIDPRSNAVADTIGVKFVVKESASKRREWNLVDDLIQACKRGSLSDNPIWRLVDRNPARLARRKKGKKKPAQIEATRLGNPLKDKVHVHDLHATILHLMGLDHERLTYRFGGRDFRLTDVSGGVVRQLIA